MLTPDGEKKREADKHDWKPPCECVNLNVLHNCDLFSPSPCQPERSETQDFAAELLKQPSLYQAINGLNENRLNTRKAFSE